MHVYAQDCEGLVRGGQGGSLPTGSEEPEQEEVKGVQAAEEHPTAGPLGGWEVPLLAQQRGWSELGGPPPPRCHSLPRYSNDVLLDQGLANARATAGSGGFPTGIGMGSSAL